MSEANEEIDDGWESDDDLPQVSSEDQPAGSYRGESERSDGGDRGRRPRRRRSDSEFVPEDDERALQALEFLRAVIHQMHMDCDVRLRRPKAGDSELEINLEIDGPDSGRVIGKKGQVLGALQFITNRVINRPGLEKRHILVDAEGYRNRRDNSLSTMAKRLGKQAITEGKIITFEPMNPRDRRVIHLALAKFDGVVTKSDGEGEDRRVQIIPVRR